MTLVLHGDHFFLLGHNRQCLETLLVIITWTFYKHLAGRDQRVIVACSTLDNLHSH
jgi:hypothetical protein